MKLVKSVPVEGTTREENSQPDAELVKLSLAGDQRAFETLCRRYLPELRRRARLVSAEPDLVDECIQQTLIRVHRSLANFDIKRAFRPWLMTIFANTLKSGWVQARKVLFYEDVVGGSSERAALMGSVDLDPLTVALHGEEESEKQALLGALSDCVGELDEDARRLYQLLFEDQMNHRTAAEVLEISHDSCRQRSVRLRRILKLCVEGKKTGR